ASFLFAPHVAEQTRFTFVQIHRPNLLRRLSRQALGIGRASNAVQLRSTGIDNGFSVQSEAQGRDALAVIARVVRDLMTNVVRRSRYPDVVGSRSVEDPGSGFRIA